MARSFTGWKAEVDIELAKILFGLTSDDLPDYLWHDTYMDGYEPADAAQLYLEEVNLGHA